MSQAPPTADERRPWDPYERSDLDAPARVERPTLVTALKRYPLIVIMPAIVLVAAGIALGLKRHPVYTASTQLNVGITDANSQATPGYEESAQELASSYSRQAISQVTARAVSRTTRQPPHLIASRLSASAVPDSPTFYINATGATPADAASLANLAASALQKSLDAAKRQSGTAVQLARYRTLQRRADALNVKAASLKNQRVNDPARVPASVVHEKQLQAQVATLQANAQSSKYTSAYSTSTGTNLEILNRANGASSDRKTYVERYGIVGLVAGLAIGAVLAFLVARVRRTPNPA